MLDEYQFKGAVFRSWALDAGPNRPTAVREHPAYAAPSEERIIVSVDKDAARGSKTFAIYADHRDLLRDIFDCDPADRNYYTYQGPERPCLFMMDVDLEYSSVPNFAASEAGYENVVPSYERAVAVNAIALFKDTLASRYPGENVGAVEVATFRACRANKVSFHIHTNVLFRSMAEMKFFANTMIGRVQAAVEVHRHRLLASGSEEEKLALREFQRLARTPSATASADPDERARRAACCRWMADAPEQGRMPHIWAPRYLLDFAKSGSKVGAECAVDSAIYSDTRWMRLPLNTKKGRGHFLEFDPALSEGPCLTVLADPANFRATVLYGLISHPTLWPSLRPGYGGALLELPRDPNWRASSIVRRTVAGHFSYQSSAAPNLNDDPGEDVTSAEAEQLGTLRRAAADFFAAYNQADHNAGFESLRRYNVAGGGRTMTTYAHRVNYLGLCMVCNRVHTSAAQTYVSANLGDDHFVFRCFAAPGVGVPVFFDADTGELDVRPGTYVDLNQSVLSRLVHTGVLSERGNPDFDPWNAIRLYNARFMLPLRSRLVSRQPGRVADMNATEDEPVVVQDFAADLDDSIALEVAKSDVGTGKSWRFRELILQNPEASIIIVSCRRTLGFNLLDRVNEDIERENQRLADQGLAQEHAGFELYSSVRDRLYNRSRLIVQFESLWRIMEATHDGSGNTVFDVGRRYDLVFLDEWVSLTHNFASPTNAEHRSANVLAIKRLVRQAAYVFAADAHMDAAATFYLFELRFEGLRTIRQRNAFTDDESLARNPQFSPSEVEAWTRAWAATRIHWNLFQNHSKRIQYTHDETLWLYLLREKLREGARLVVPGNSKAALFRIFYMLRKWMLEDDPERYPDEQAAEDDMLFYHSGVADAIKRQAGNCVVEWVRKRIVLYTPTIGPGVDFNVHHFGWMFAYAVSGSSSARDFVQQINRVRTDLTVYMYASKPRTSAQYPTSATAVRELLRLHCSTLSRIEQNLLMNVTEDHKLFESNYMWTAVNRQTEIYGTMNNFVRTLGRYCPPNSVTLCERAFISKLDRKHVAIERLEIEKKSKLEFSGLITAQPDVDARAFAELRNLVRNNQADEAALLTCRKYEIRRDTMNGVGVVTQILVDISCSEIVRRQFKEFQTFMQEWQEVGVVDWYDEDNPPARNIQAIISEIQSQYTLNQANPGYGQDVLFLCRYYAAAAFATAALPTPFDVVHFERLDANLREPQWEWFWRAEGENFALFNYVLNRAFPQQASFVPAVRRKRRLGRQEAFEHDEPLPGDPDDSDDEPEDLGAAAAGPEGGLSARGFYMSVLKPIMKRLFGLAMRKKKVRRVDTARVDTRSHAVSMYLEFCYAMAHFEDPHHRVVLGWDPARYIEEFGTEFRYCPAHQVAPPPGVVRRDAVTLRSVDRLNQSISRRRVECAAILESDGRDAAMLD